MAEEEGVCVRASTLWLDIVKVGFPSYCVLFANLARLKIESIKWGSGTT